MRSRSIGRHDLALSEVGLGTWQLSNTTSFPGKGARYVSPSDARTVIASALDLGVNFFETSDLYGDAESLLGQTLSRKPEEAVIATKAGLREDGVRDFSPGYLTKQIERSLKRLRRDAIDIFLLAKPSLDELRHDSVRDFLEKLKRDGKARLVGIVVGDLDAGQYCVDSGGYDCLQVMFNLIYTDSANLIDTAAKAGLGVVVRSPLNSGVLSGTYHDETKFPSWDMRSRWFAGDLFSKRLMALGKIIEEIPVPRENLVDYALKFILSHDGVTSIVPGTASQSQLKKYAACGDGSLFEHHALERTTSISRRVMSKIPQAVQNIGSVSK